MRVLQIEDDASTAGLVEMMLSSEGFRVNTTDLGEEGIELAKLYDYDAITLDLTLPDMNGASVIHALRAAKVWTPIIVVSGGCSWDQIDQRVKVLRAGADDVMGKPFHKDELVARLQAVIRRANGHAAPKLEVGPVSVDPASHRAAVHGKPLHLTSKEYQMLELMLLRRGSTISKEGFLNHLYGGHDEPELKIVDVFMCKLRKKLADAGAVGFIETIWGRGYTFRDTPMGPREVKPRIIYGGALTLATRVAALLRVDRMMFAALLTRLQVDNANSLRATIALMLGRGEIENVGRPMAAIYQITDKGRGAYPVEDRTAA